MEVANFSGVQATDWSWGALIFDFDGTILDTETPAFLGWQHIYGNHGHTLTFEDYSLVIGPNISDLAGNLLDQNRNGSGGEDPGDDITATFTISDVSGFPAPDLPLPISDDGNSYASSLTVQVPVT